MLAVLLAILVAGAPAQAVQTAPQPAPGAAPAVTANLATPDDYKRLRADLPKASKPAKLLNALEIASAQDYPKEALAGDQQGEVGVWLLVGVDGRVQRCGIEHSSGSAELDTQTCDLFVANARFRPAQGKGGRAVASIYTERMVWRLEGEEAITVRNQIARESFILGPDGELRSCKGEFRITADKWIEGPKERCAAFADKAAPLLLAAREKSKLHDAHVVLEASIFTDASEAMPPIGNGPGDTLVYLRRVTMSFDPSGKRTGCIKGESLGTVEFRAEPCADPRLDRLPAEMLEAGMAVETVRFQWAVYLKNEPK